jgi:hypothetical protein
VTETHHDFVRDDGNAIPVTYRSISNYENPLDRIPPIGFACAPVGAPRAFAKLF